MTDIIESIDAEAARLLTVADNLVEHRLAAQEIESVSARLTTIGNELRNQLNPPSGPQSRPESEAAASELYAELSGI